MRGNPRTAGGHRRRGRPVRHRLRENLQFGGGSRARDSQSAGPHVLPQEDAHDLRRGSDASGQSPRLAHVAGRFRDQERDRGGEQEDAGETARGKRICHRFLL